MRSRHAWFAAALIVFALQQATAAPPVAVRDQAVDLLALVGGERLLGMLVAPPVDAAGPPGGVGPPGSDTVVFLVERAWLEKRQPALYRQTTKDEAKRRREALEQLRARLTDWRERRAEPRVLAGFLDRRIADVEKHLASANDAGRAPEASQLLLLELPVKRVSQSYVQPAERRRLLGLAWEERLADVEGRSAADLTAELREHKVDIDLAQPDISDRLPMLPQTDRQWAAKVGLVEFQILAKPHFQGSGSVLVRDDGGQQRPPIGDLLGSLMQDQLGDALGDLLNDPLGNGPLGNAGGGRGRPQGDDRRRQAIEKALASATNDGLRGARVSYLEQDLLKHQVTVTETFHARMPDDAWLVVWQQSATVDARQAAKEGGSQLAEDPQIAEIIKSMKQLGLGANDDLLQTALGFGAATQQALRQTDREFGHFLLMNTRRLTGPPLVVPDAPAP